MSGEQPRPPARRLYRDTLVLNVVLAALIVLISWATGGDLQRAFVFAILYFLVATAWAWWRFKQRDEKEQA